MGPEGRQYNGVWRGPWSFLSATDQLAILAVRDSSRDGDKPPAGAPVAPGAVDGVALMIEASLRGLFGRTTRHARCQITPSVAVAETTPQAQRAICCVKAWKTKFWWDGGEVSSKHEKLNNTEAIG